MSNFNFRILELKNTTAAGWLQSWSDRYDRENDDEKEYRRLIENWRSLSSEDFEAVGKWKDGAFKGDKWKPNVASVAYPIWMQAALESPRCPEEDRLVAFLEDWSGRTYVDEYSSGVRTKRFGLSRATTLLHFISGARYPIFDSRVRTAIARLTGSAIADLTVPKYFEYYALFKELLSRCESEDDPRKLDKALFSYGSTIPLLPV